MRAGLILSLVAGLVWSLGNVIDKVSVTRIVKSPLFLLYLYLMISVVMGAAVAPLVSHSLAGQDVLRIFGISVLYTLGTFLYFVAMRREEPSRVVPLYSLVVLFLAIFGAIFLGEVFTWLTYLGIALLIIGTVGITSRRGMTSSFRSRALGIMVASSLCYSLAYVIMKKLLGSYTPWDIFVYQRLFTGGLGLLLLPFVYRHLRNVLVSVPKKKYLAFSFLSEFFGESGALLFIVATSLWYVTLVETTVNIQFVFIFIFGIVVTRLWPKLYTEEAGGRILMQKAVSIALMIVGIAIISR